MAPASSPRHRGFSVFLRSPQFAAAVICTYIVLLVAGIFVPQAGSYSEDMIEFWVKDSGIWGTLARELGFTRLQTSGLLIATHIAFFVSVVLCMIHRFRLARSWLTLSFPESGQGLSGQAHQIRVPGQDPETVLRSATEELKRRRYHINPHQDGQGFTAFKGRTAVLGSIVFHLAFLIIAVAGILSALSYFSGIAFVGVGEEFSGSPTDYTYTSSEDSGEIPEISFRLLDIDTHFGDQDHLDRFEASVMTDQGEQVRIGVNHPYYRGALAVYLVSFGYAPLWLLQTPVGETLDGAFVKLLSIGQEDHFETGQHPYQVFVSLYPDWESIEGRDTTRSFELNNPVLAVRVENRRELLFEGQVRPGEPIPLGREQLIFPEIRKWAQFKVIHDEGTSTAFFGFGVLCLGLLLRFIRLRKAVIGRWDSEGVQGLRLTGRAEIFPFAFSQELEKLERRLQQKPQAPAISNGFILEHEGKGGPSV